MAIDAVRVGTPVKLRLPFMGFRQCENCKSHCPGRNLYVMPTPTRHQWHELTGSYATGGGGRARRRDRCVQWQFVSNLSAATNDGRLLYAFGSVVPHRSSRSPGPGMGLIRLGVDQPSETPAVLTGGNKKLQLCRSAATRVRLCARSRLCGDLGVPVDKFHALISTS